MPSPFDVFQRLFVAGVKITRYFVVSTAQSLWYLAHLRTDKVGDVIGSFGRGVADAVAEVFKK